MYPREPWFVRHENLWFVLNLLLLVTGVTLVASGGNALWRILGAFLLWGGVMLLIAAFRWLIWGEE